MGGRIDVAPAATRGPPPGFGGPPAALASQQPRPKKVGSAAAAFRPPLAPLRTAPLTAAPSLPQVSPPPGFGGPPSGHSSLDAAAPPASDAPPGAYAYAPFGAGHTVLHRSGGAPPDRFAPPGAHLAAAAGGLSDAAAGSRRSSSRFAFAQAEEDAAAAAAVAAAAAANRGALGGFAGGAPPPAQLQFPVHTAPPPAPRPHPAPASSPQDAGSFFKSLFPGANVNVAPAPAAQRPAMPPGFGGPLAMPAPPGAAHPMSASPGSLYNPLAGLFPSQPPAPAPPLQQQPAAAAGGRLGVAPGLALLRQLQGGAPVAASGLPGPSWQQGR